MTERSQFRLLAERRFLPFFLTQFFGAANDNVFKFAFTVLATYSAAQWGGMDPTSAGAVIGGIFILPSCCSLLPRANWPTSSRNRR